MRKLALTTGFVCLSGCSVTETPVTGMIKTPPTVSQTTVPMIVEGDQLLVELDAVRPDGRTRKLLANVNMGLSHPGLQAHVYKELAIDQDHAFSFRLGGIPISVDANTVDSLDDAAPPDRQLGSFFFPQKVEAWLQAGVLEQFDIVLDYANKTMTLAQPGSLPAEGTAVPIRLNKDTGLVTVDLTVDGRAYPIVIDSGGGYSWIRRSIAGQWEKAHPEWQRTEGAVGLSNYNMLPYAFEKEGTVLRLPEASIGDMKVQNIGFLGAGPALGWPWDNIFGEVVFDFWQKGAPEPVIGWLGANVLKHYRLTIDYRNQMSYWLKNSDIDPRELDQVGLTLVYDKGSYSVGGIVAKDGKPTVEGVQIGDKILSIDEAPVQGWSRDQIFSALHGKAGDRHRLSVERDGKNVTLSLPVTLF
jgi:hypothetical protein